jgi:hypothetical protein
VAKSPKFTVGNAKLGPDMLTWSRPYGETCPDTCELLDAGCYADPKRGFRMQAMYKGAARRLGHVPPIASMRAKDTLRLHVSGDFMAKANANDLMAVRRRADTAYIEGIREQLVAKSDAEVFTYSHMWQEYESDLAPLRDLMTINASCATAKQVREAVDAKWRVAYHGPDVSPDATYHEIGGERLLVCPEQRGKVDNCAECKVCWNSSTRFAGVAFIDH